MKNYENAKLEYVELLTKDVITTSFSFGEAGDGGAGTGGEAGGDVM